MKIFDIALPAVNYGFYKESDLKFIRDSMLKMKANYGTIFEKFSKMLNIPVELYYAFCYIESAGNPNLVSPAGAIGLFQVVPDIAEDIFAKTMAYKYITPELKREMNRLFGNELANCLLSKAYAGQKKCGITEDMLKNSEINTLIFSLILKYLLNKEFFRLDRVVIKYNWGMFRNVSPTATVEDTLKLNLPSETRNYILKLLGTNGTLTIATYLRERGQL